MKPPVTALNKITFSLSKLKILLVSSLAHLLLHLAPLLCACPPNPVCTHT